LLIMFGILGLAGLNAQVTLEDFESGASLTWEALDGTYDGVVENPDVEGLNASANCGSYTKSGTNSFSLFRAVLAEPLDLSTNNEFSIQVYAGAATQILLKLEGDGEAIEATQNIATPNVWRTYTFDFSDAASFTTLNTIILFFDPGVEESMDTYLFDNLVASPAGPCAGTVEDVTIIDDFECQRNASYGVPGFDDLMVIPNPDQSGINTSPTVGEYTDREGGFHAFVINYPGDIDLSTNNFYCIKVWAPVAGDLLFKLEGGGSPAFETPVAITETETWVEACVDFSSQAAASHTRYVLFFNAGVADADGDIYYIDDLTRTPVPTPEALEDFEDGASLSWEPLNNDNTLHGTFNGVITNPDQSDPNTSPNIGSYSRGSSNFSTLTALLPNGIDLSGNSQINMDVWVPDGVTEVLMQLQSPTQGTQGVTVDVPATMSWQTLNFSFEDFDNVTDFERINLLFAPQTMTSGTFFFDNVAQGQVTVDACEGVETVATIFDDFECQRNVPITCCDVTVTPIDNPDITPANNSLTVGEVVDPPGSFNALVYNVNEVIDLSVNSQIAAKIWSPIDGQILFKLEGGDGVEEIFVDIPATNEWVQYEVDFSAAANEGHTRLVLFFGAGVENMENVTYFLDDVELRREPFRNDCISDFETSETTVDTWRYFANGDFEGNAFIISDNPNVSAENPSARVGTFEEAGAMSGGPAEFAGAFADLPAPIELNSDNRTLRVKMLMDVAGSVVFKLEAGIDGSPNSGDLFADYTTPGEWQELTYDLNTTAGGDPIPDGSRYGRLTIIPNFGIVPDDDLTHYFDDITIGSGNCQTTSIFNPVEVAELSIFPNPTKGLLTIQNNESAVTFRVQNLLGQSVQTLTTNIVQPRVDLQLYDLPKGMYVLTAHGENGQLIAKTTFVKR
ncbi:MAG: T9SS type A sorting domain-containing protein, partial [Bacteroidota bacterium]